MAKPIVISILANANQANRTLNQTLTTTQRVGNGFRKMAGPATLALGGIIALGGKAANAAAEDARSQTILATSLRKSAKATDQQVAATERWIDKTARATGVADDQLRPALGSLVRGTGSLEKAQKGLGLALDVAALTGKDVTRVSDALSKGYGGNTAALGRLIPGFDKAILKTGDMKKITAELARLSGGTAAKAAKTEAGQRARANVALDESVETIGARLLPAYAKAAKLGADTANWLAKNERTAYLLAGGIAALAAIILVVNVAMKVATAVTAIYNGVMKTVAVASKVWAAAQLALNIAFALFPVTVIVLAVIAFVAAIVLAYKKSETFRNIVTGAFQKVKNVASIALGWIRKNWPLLLAILTGPIGLAVLFIVKKRDAIIAAFKAVPGKIKSALGNVKTMLYDAGKSIISGLINGITDKLGDLYGKVKGIGSKIKSLKGPLSYDKVMLKPEGAAIIQGLIAGIASEENALYRKVRTIGRNLASTSFSVGSGSLGTPEVALAGVGGGSVVKNFNIKVLLNPSMTVAEMGAEYKKAIKAADELGI